MVITTTASMTLAATSATAGPRKRNKRSNAPSKTVKMPHKRGGTCIKHGGRYKRRYYCSVDGCTRYPKRGGLCKSHGAKITRPLCQIEGCTNVETNKGVCIRHGAKVKLCSVTNCPNQSLKGGVCWSHGAKNTKVKKKCSVEDCDSHAYTRGLCTKHGAKRCSVGGCPNQAKPGGMCITHGATPVKRKLCSISGCPNQSKIEGYCKRHKTMITNAEKEATTIIEAPPGILGLTLKIDNKLGGAKVAAIQSDSTVRGRIEVGDRIISIDDHVITQISDFGVNSHKTRLLRVAVRNALETVLFKEVSDLGERMKMNLSGTEIAAMSSQIQRLIQSQEESLNREAALSTQLKRAAAKEKALEAQLKEWKSRAKEWKDENATLKASLAREQRRAKKCPTCKE
jgi:hypothetical protein